MSTADPPLSYSQLLRLQASVLRHGAKSLETIADALDGKALSSDVVHLAVLGRVNVARPCDTEEPA